MNQTVVPAASIHSYGFNLYRLESEMQCPDPDVERTVELLESLTRLKGIQDFGVIGDEAEHCLEYFVEQKAGPDRDVRSVTLDQREQVEMTTKTQEWIDRFEHHIESAVAQAPTTEIPPNQLLAGSHELLAEHVGEQFEHEVRDLNEAASNLCAGSYTSAEFMCIRAVERLLRQYFHEEMDGVADTDWSEALDAVVASADDGQLPEELAILEYLQERRRHIVHPERHSGQGDAEETLLKTFKLVDILIDRL